MTTTGEEISWKNARAILRDIGMPHLDWAHGAAVNIVRQCLNTRHRPTYHQQTFLETESPALLTYLERLSTSGDATGWRTLRDRVQSHAEFLRETDMQPCARPWLAAIWHALPELAAIGKGILDDREEPKSVADFEAAPVPSDAGASSGNGSGGDDKGSAGKAGSAGTVAKPKPSPRLALPVVAVVLTEAEKKAFADPERDPNATNHDAAPGVPDGADGPTGPKPGAPK